MSKQPVVDIKRLAVVDIETVGVTGTFADLSERQPRLAAKWLERAKWLKERYKDTNGSMSTDDLWQHKAGLHSEYGKVICVSFGVFGDDGKKVHSYYGDDEAEVLTKTATALERIDEKKRILAGHTIERFDIPFLWKRMLINRISPPGIINTWGKKPWDLNYFDLAKFWSGGAWQESFTSLDTLSAIFGVKSPKEDVKGSGVHGLYWHNAGLESIKTYCEGDIVATMNVIQILADI